VLLHGTAFDATTTVASATVASATVAVATTASTKRTPWVSAGLQNNNGDAN